MRRAAPLICPRVFAPADTGTATASVRALDGRHILIAEDEGLLALDMEFALVDAGASVLGPIVEIESGLDLLAAVAQPIDAAILDLDLRGVAAYPLADYLAERGIPFVFQTGHGIAADLKARYGEHVHVLAKPCRTERLIDVLADITTRAG